jgi:hypothetical protein
VWALEVDGIAAALAAAGLVSAWAGSEIEMDKSAATNVLIIFIMGSIL